MWTYETKPAGSHKVLRLTEQDGKPCLIVLSDAHSLLVYSSNDQLCVELDSGSGDPPSFCVRESVEDIMTMLGLQP